MNNKERIRDYVRKNYSAVAAKGSGGCCCSGSNCCGGQTDVKGASASIGYSQNDLEGVPEGANMGLGCGNPIAIAGLKEGEVVLDLGSGGGFDCFLARKRVGKTGYVLGVDMTPDMVKLARENAYKSGYDNVDFRLGEIEHLPVPDGSVDVIISNCVINLSPEKQQVFRDAYRVLKPGGRLSISDVVATRVMPPHMKQDLDMIAGCIGGAEHVEDLRRMLSDAGFKNIRMNPKENSREIVNSWMQGRNLGDYVASYIIEAEK